MTKIYLARHGQDKDNEMGILNRHRDMPLTEIGLDQASQVAQQIRDSAPEDSHIFNIRQYNH